MAVVNSSQVVKKLNFPNRSTEREEKKTVFIFSRRIRIGNYTSGSEKTNLDISTKNGNAPPGRHLIGEQNNWKLIE